MPIARLPSDAGDVRLASEINVARALCPVYFPVGRDIAPAIAPEQFSWGNSLSGFPPGPSPTTLAQRIDEFPW